MPTLPQPGLLYSVLAFIAAISVLVFVHEWGHYAMARLFKVRAEAFAIGFGRELIGWTDKQGCRWKICAVPLGGYVKFAGDANAASLPLKAEAIPVQEREGLFQFKPLWQRALIVAAGPAINFLFAIGIFAITFATVGQVYTPPVVSEVLPDSAAQRAGFQAGDVFVKVGGQTVDRFEDVAYAVATNGGRPMRFDFLRAGQPQSFLVVPEVVQERDRFGNFYERGRLGVAAAAQDVVRRAPLAAIGYAVLETRDLTRTMMATLWEIVSGRRSVTELGGPVKIAQVSGQSAALGLQAFVTFMALISINLGFVNLLPLPMLDGGHLFLYGLEALRRRPLSQKVQEWAFMAGFAAMISLTVFLTWNDLGSVGVWETLSRVFS